MFNDADWLPFKSDLCYSKQRDGPPVQAISLPISFYFPYTTNKLLKKIKVLQFSVRKISRGLKLVKPETIAYTWMKEQARPVLLHPTCAVHQMWLQTLQGVQVEVIYTRVSNTKQTGKTGGGEKLKGI